MTSDGWMILSAVSTAFNMFLLLVLWHSYLEKKSLEYTVEMLDRNLSICKTNRIIEWL
jgi:hypothetical protein